MKRSGVMSSSESVAAFEQRLLSVYDGSSSNLPQMLMINYVSPATRLLEKRRQMFEIQEALDARKEEFLRRDDAFRRREDALRRKDLELQESLIKFNKFLQENESKKNRAMKRMNEERRHREAKESEIKSLSDQLAAKKKEEHDLKRDVERNRKYQEYLENVVQFVGKDFPEISDLLNRYWILKEARVSLTAKQTSDEKESDKLRTALSIYTKEKETEILNRSNEIAALQLKLEQQLSLGTRLRVDAEQSMIESSEKVLELGQIFSCVDNLLTRCETSFELRHNKPAKSARKPLAGMRLPVEEMWREVSTRLDEISAFTIDYMEICKEGKDGREPGHAAGGRSSNVHGPSSNMSSTGDGADEVASY